MTGDGARGFWRRHAVGVGRQIGRLSQSLDTGRAPGHSAPGRREFSQVTRECLAGRVTATPPGPITRAFLRNRLHRQAGEPRGPQFHFSRSLTRPARDTGRLPAAGSSPAACDYTPPRHTCSVCAPRRPRPHPFVPNACALTCISSWEFSTSRTFPIAFAFDPALPEIPNARNNSSHSGLFSPLLISPIRESMRTLVTAP